MVILVTGGTSGLGFELVKILLQQGNYVIVTGRNQLNDPDKTGRLIFYRTDFSDLKQVAETAKTIGMDHSPDCVVNNAGILSPPHYTETGDGFEYTFQVNFLAHMLLDEIIMKLTSNRHPLLIVSVTSLAYRIAPFDTGIGKKPEEYRPYRSYPASKLFLAVMTEFLASKHPQQKLKYFSYDPGIFSSRIYRMQKKWFRSLYVIGAHFMRNPSVVAGSLAELLSLNSASNGMIYKRSKDSRSLQDILMPGKAEFMSDCYNLIEKYI
jgi:NAD(P)-dependent dehydrogenase (short-subunit alcohol dehydrogenase family)